MMDVEVSRCSSFISMICLLTKEKNFREFAVHDIIDAKDTASGNWRASFPVAHNIDNPMNVQARSDGP
jgi:hypothetical protein